MKKYIFYINEISKRDLYDGLVGYGFFAEKIPNFLTADNFLKYTKSLTFPINKHRKDFIRYSSMRNINIPRAMGIPEPFAYADQAKCLSDNWEKLQKYFEKKTEKDTFKISRIHLRKFEKNSGLFKMNYKKNFSKDGEPEQDMVIRSKYVASADISNCFPSIYSHAISWALVEKKEAKLKSKDKDKDEWFNQIDYKTRNIKYGETNGVLIGPHSSNLISEIILVAVDHELTKHGFKYIRNIDDYTCYVETYEEADKFFLILSEELKKYELALNSKKSKITPLPLASIEGNWVNKLSLFNFIDTYTVKSKEEIKVKELKGIKVKELKSFIGFAIELMLKEDSNAAILNYAIQIISKKYLGTNAKDYYMKQIHHLVLLYPYLVTILEYHVFEPHKIDKNIIKKIAGDIYEYGIKKKMYEACSYAIYWAIRYDFCIEKTTIRQDSIKSLDCIFLMISYLYDKKHQEKDYLQEYKELSKKLIEDRDFDRYWLFIYETLDYKELEDDNYKKMKENGVTFIKLEFNS